jgi:hypothetical protein
VWITDSHEGDGGPGGTAGGSNANEVGELGTPAGAGAIAAQTAADVIMDCTTLACAASERPDEAPLLRTSP